MQQSELPVPPPDQQSFDEDWVLKPKNSIVDLNPYFGHEHAGIALFSEKSKEMRTKIQSKKQEIAAHMKLYTKILLT